MDFLDKAILAKLQSDSGLSVNEISDAVGLSATPCWRRIKRLEDAGVIRRRVAILEPAALNLGLTAFVSVKVARHDEGWIRSFAEQIAQMPEILEAHRMSGEIDYLLKIVCPDMASFDAIYKRLIRLADFSEVRSTFSMETMKASTALPLDYA